ncbi:pre-mRNA 3'-end-processing factor FIP1-like [Anolis sagrei]|uniref:pre-mRNA 3'-end-processing factor FIP1-like n=1 Tax=Anolis sagrei TaxID=38937 RepID=UPI003521664A
MAATELELEPAAVQLEADEDEEQWLYGDDNGKLEDGPISGNADPHPLQDLSKVGTMVNCEDRELLQQVFPSGEDDEDDSDSDSDDDDIRVTIGNIKTGAPSYMGTPMNLNLKTGRGYGAPTTAKSQPKGIDLEAAGNINGLPAIEADLESFEDKPWRKPGADLSDYFNYGFNEETWKAYCEKQRRLQLGLESSPPVSVAENKITVQQGRTGNTEKEPENNIIKMDFKTDFVALVGGRIKAGPPPNRKLGGTIDVIGGQAGTIRRVEGRRRDKHASEENPIQVLGDHGSKPPQAPPQPSQQPQPPPQQQQAFAPPARPPPPLGGPPPPHFLHPPPPPVSSVPPPLHPPGLPPAGPIPGLFPPPLAPPPALLIPTLDGQPAGYNNRQPPPFGYSSSDSGFISYPPISTSHTPWVTTVDKGSGASDGCHWEYSNSRRERERDRDRTPTTSEYNNDDERYRYYSSRERNYDFERDYRRSRDRSREREDRHRERRHRDKEEGSKHKSSRRKQHESEEGETHRRHKHKKNKRSKEEKEANEDGTPEGNGQDSKE